MRRGTMQNRNSFSVLPFLFLSFIFVLIPQASFGLDHIKQTTDIDGDNLGDLILWDPSAARFIVRKSSDLSITEESVGNVGDVEAAGDYNGDGKTDLATFNRSTATWTIKTTGGSTNTIQFGATGDIPVPGDYRGLGCHNLATYNMRTGVWRIGDCDGGNESTSTLGGPQLLPVPGDYDCDNQLDKATYNRWDSRWTIEKSSDSSTSTFFFGLRGDIPVQGDWDNDGCDEAAVHRPTFNQFFYNTSVSEGNVSPASPARQWGLNADRPVLANVGRDRVVDRVVYRADENAFYILTSTNFFFYVPFPVLTSSGSGSLIRLPDVGTRAVIQDIFGAGIPIPLMMQRVALGAVPGDYNRDGRSDFALARVDRSRGQTTWSTLTGPGTAASVTLSSPGDALVAADYNGDGRMQPAVVYVRSDGNLEWTIRNPNGTETKSNFGVNTNRPIVADFDCDGKADRAVVKNGDIFLFWDIELTGGNSLSDFLFGLLGDSVYAADVNADGCAELIITREAEGAVFWVWRSIFESINHIVQWGLSGDKQVPPFDMNGDGAADFMVVREAGGGQIIFTQYVDISDLDCRFPNCPWTFEFFGLAGDDPVPGNFTGTNRGEVGIFRRTGGSGQFIIKRWNGANHAVNLGSPSDVLVRPDGTAVQAGSGGGNGGGGGSSGCNATPGTEGDFRDGAGNALWKPVSEGVPNGAPAMLLPRSYEGSSISILSASGQQISGIQRTRCCPNGNRSHFWAEKTASFLASFKPITVKINRPDGATECRVVPEPTQRVD